MSKSKRTARAEGPSTTDGAKVRLARSGWLNTLGLLAVSLAALAAVTVALRLGLNALLDRLFAAWNLRADTVARAPGWAQALYGWRGALVTLAVGAALLSLCRPLRALWGLRPGGRRGTMKMGGFGLLTGVGIALLIALLSLLPDSARLSWPLSAPRLNGALPALCLISLVGVLAEEAFARGVLQDGLKNRLGGHWASAVACAAFFVMRGGWSGGWVYGVNVLLTGLVCCLLYARYGLTAAVGFRWGLEAFAAYIMGFGGGSAAVYQLYGVSETLLTGGDSGPLYGLWLALAMLALVVMLHRKTRNPDH